eukprot:jgi/Tetstr1/456353/TSEL_043089.t1
MCSGGPLPPTICVAGLRKRMGHMVQWRPNDAGQLRARGCGSSRGTLSSGGPLPPTSCMPGPRKRPGHWVQWRLTTPTNCVPGAAKASGAQSAALARCRRPVACPRRGSGRGTGCMDGPMAPTSFVPRLRKRLSAIDRGTECNGGPMASTS